MVRQFCTECNSALLWWGTPAELLELRVAQTEGENLLELDSLMHAAVMCGPDGEAWLCQNCREWGIMGGLESGTEFGRF